MFVDEEECKKKRMGRKRDSGTGACCCQTDNITRTNETPPAPAPRIMRANERTEFGTNVRVSIGRSSGTVLDAIVHWIYTYAWMEGFD